MWCVWELDYKSEESEWGRKCASAPVAVTVTESLLNPLRVAEAQ